MAGLKWLVYLAIGLTVWLNWDKLKGMMNKNSNEENK